MQEEKLAWRLAAWLLLTFLPVATLAQTSAVRVSGQVSASDVGGATTGTSGGFMRVTFSCTGTPSCSGTYAVSERDDNCSNSFSFGGTLVITGLDLSAPRTLSGSILPSTGSDSMPNPNGTCTYATKPGNTNITYTATWDGSTGILTLGGVDGSGHPITGNGTFTASLPSAPPPVFPMTVTSNVTTTTATATAQVAPRSQDVGTTASVYVFAHAPANVIRKSLEGKQVTGPSVGFDAADDTFCVLSQLNSNGQLSAVTSSTMQAFTSGVLSSQSQAVNILNNVPTSNVAGATFYIGYGSSAATMLANGVYQNALTVPGGSQCTASLAAAPAPQSPGPLSGLWWNASESGWGVHFTQRRGIIFAAWYTYDASGNPKWYVASSCPIVSANPSSTSGTCTGPLYDVKGPTFFGTAFNPALVSVTTAGNLQVSFTDANTASMTYTAAGVTRTVALTRQPIASGTTTPAVDYTDLWWNPNESGWGMAIAQQYGVMFLAWYVYDNTGKPVWYVASNCLVDGSSCSGTLYRTTGPVFGPTFDSSRVQVFTVGTVNVNFTDANNGQLSYTVNGVASSKVITRQTF